MFAHTDTSQRKGVEFLVPLRGAPGRTRRADKRRARDAQYDAIVLLAGLIPDARIRIYATRPTASSSSTDRGCGRRQRVPGERRSADREHSTDPDSWAFETLTVPIDGAVLFAEIAAPPMNLLGPELVRTSSPLSSEPSGQDIQVLVFRSADPDYFISHVDLTQVAAYRAEAAKLSGEASIALLFRT